MMETRDAVIELLAQTLAPRLYKLFDMPPEEMGFPIKDTKEEVDRHLARQFDPVNYWLGEARAIAEAVVNIIEAGGATIASLEVDAMLKAAAKERPDIVEGEHVSL